MRPSAVVVVGSGQAGCQVALSLRDKGYSGPITVIGEEGVSPYQRPPLTKAYLAGDTDLSGVVLRHDSYYADQDIELRLDDPATAIDRQARHVVLRSGDAVPYEHLVLATGARPRRLSGGFALRTIADADALRGRLTEHSRIVVIGAGFVGLEFAAVTRARGHDVTVVEALPRAMSRVVSERTAEHIVSLHREHGVRVLLDSPVAAVAEDFVELARGPRLAADLVVVGIGVLPNVELAEAAGLAVDNGIVVDAHLRTTDPAIHAIGDCASFSSTHTGKRLRLESVQNAVDQATSVTEAILGSAEPYTEVPWFWSDQYDAKLQIAGITDGHDHTVVTGDPSTGGFSVFCFAGDRLLGVESVNKPADYVMARRLLSAGGNLTPADVAAPGFTLRAHLQAA